MLKIPEMWLWDFWFAQDGPYYHIFYLQAPKSLGDEKLRHWHATIGHAVSEDLTNWEILPDALHPTDSSKPSWDNYTTWTGSVIAYGGLWYLYYTGSSREENGLVQRIGFASSDDLVNWRKFPNNPVLVADSEQYEILESGLWHDQAWRDPWLFFYDGAFHCYVTARVNYGPSLERGVIAHATSQDLIHWSVMEPVTNPGEFGFLEVPQLVNIDERWYLFFCTGTRVFSEQRLERPGVNPEIGTHYMVADNPLGPFKMVADDFLIGDEVGSRYTCKVIKNPSGDWVILWTLAWSEDGYVGEISDPVPLQIGERGLLSVTIE